MIGRERGIEGHRERLAGREGSRDIETGWGRDRDRGT